jgi:hypothetical protein
MEKFKSLRPAVLHYLARPSSSCSSERFFSYLTMVTEKHRFSLHNITLQNLAILKSNWESAEPKFFELLRGTVKNVKAGIQVRQIGLRRARLSIQLRLQEQLSKTTGAGASNYQTISDLHTRSKELETAFNTAKREVEGVDVAGFEEIAADIGRMFREEDVAEKEKELAAEAAVFDEFEAQVLAPSTFGRIRFAPAKLKE